MQGLESPAGARVLRESLPPHTGSFLVSREHLGCGHKRIPTGKKQRLDVGQLEVKGPRSTDCVSVPLSDKSDKSRGIKSSYLCFLTGM